MSTFAFDSTYYVNKWGFLLVRYSYSDDTWRILTFVQRGESYVEQLDPGDYVYQIWMIIGTDASIAQLSVNDTSRISVMGVKK